MFPVHPAFARQIMEDRIAEARRDAAPRRIKRRLQGGEPAPITRRASEEAGAEPMCRRPAGRGGRRMPGRLKGDGMRTIDVFGVPSSMAAFAPGQERAPAALRAAGLLDGLRRAGHEVRDRDDVPVRRWRPDRECPRAQNVAAVVEVVRETTERVASSARNGAVALVLGGDCTVGLGTVAAFSAPGAPSVRLVYFDLHPDMNVPSAVREGALDWTGMAHALGIDGAEPALIEAAPRIPLLDPDRLWLFAYGPDNRTAFEKEQIQRLGVRGAPVEEVEADPEGTAQRALDALLAPGDRLLVHLDVDVIDFVDLPLSENAGRNEGLSFDAAVRALSVLWSNPALAAVTVCELNPDHDPDGSALPRFVHGLVEALAA